MAYGDTLAESRLSACRNAEYAENIVWHAGVHFGVRALFE
jgi:hypothetical protein